MKTIKLLCLNLLLIHTTFLSRSQSSSSSRIDSAAHFKIDSIVQYHVDENQFSGIVMLADKGQVTYQKTVGWKNIQEGSLIDSYTQFSIASMTKMITSIIIMQMDDEELLSIDDPVSKWIPELNIPNAQKIKIHHLLLHTSGLPNEPQTVYMQKNPPKRFVEICLAKGITGETNKFNYANIDYVILGLIIEKATRKPWEEEVNQRIIYPLNLDHTGFLSKDSKPGNYAAPYQINTDGEVIPDPSFYIENFYASGNMFSNIYDLLKLDQAMYDPAFLPLENRKKMFTSYPEYNYSGYGVWTYRYPFVDGSPLVMERRGGILGANVVMIRILDTCKTIIILSNNNKFQPDSFGDPHNLREALLRIWGK
jgi:CubicO group peptidase (beta-lactamase class C family)